MDDQKNDQNINTKNLAMAWLQKRIRYGPIK